MKKNCLLSLLMLLICCDAWAGTTAPTGGPHMPGTIAEANLVTVNGKKYEVFFSNNASQSSLLVGSNTSETTEATSTTSWCNIGSSCGNSNNSISTAFTIEEFVSNVKTSNHKIIRVQSLGASEKNIVMVVKGYDAISVLAKSNDIYIYAEEYNGDSYGSSTSLTLNSSSNKSSHYKRSFLIDPTKQYRLTIAYGTSGSTNKDIVAFSLRIPSHDITIDATYRWASMYVDFPAKVPAGVTAYWASNATNTSITLSPITEGQTIPANTGVVLTGAAGKYTFSYSSATPETVSNNKFKGCLVETDASTIVGTKYVLSPESSENDCVFAPYTGENLGANKVYMLAADGPALAGDRIHFIIEDENNATDIEAIKSEVKAVKFIENGRVLIEREGVVYDALGRVVR